MPTRWSSLLLLALALALAPACSPGVRITRQVPSVYNLGATRRVAVLEVNGPRERSRQVSEELARQIFEQRHFELINALDRGASFRVRAPGLRIDISDVRQRVDADVYLVADVKECGVTVQEPTSPGAAPVHRARAALLFQVVKHDGRVLVFRDYVAERTATDPQQAVGLEQAALHDAVASFLRDITPVQVWEKIELDDLDTALKPGVELAERGDLAAAERSWQRVLERQPDHAGAHYNLGVLDELQGEYEAAEARYRRAIQRRPDRDLYRDALDSLHRRLADQRALTTAI